MDEPVIVAARNGVTLQRAEALPDLAERFARHHVIRLPGFLDNDLLGVVHESMAGGVFAPREDPGIAIELSLQANRALDVMMFVMNAPQLLETVRAISGCNAAGAFAGRIYRLDPAVPHHDSWHDDTAAGGRLVGCSVNLGHAPFSGGEFQIREKRDPERVMTIANSGAGDAILFRIAPEFEHRVRPVVGDVPKTAMAGWFLEGTEDYWSLLRREAAVLAGR